MWWIVDTDAPAREFEICFSSRAACQTYIAAFGAPSWVPECRSRAYTMVDVLAMIETMRDRSQRSYCVGEMMVHADCARDRRQQLQERSGWTEHQPVVISQEQFNRCKPKK